MSNRHIAGQTLPQHRGTDREPLFRIHRWLANLCALAIGNVESFPYAPVTHPFIERLIGTIRRECLDRAFFWNAMNLTRTLAQFQDDYTTFAAFIARWRERPPLLLLRSIITRGSRTLATRSRPRSPLEHHFATHSRTRRCPGREDVLSAVCPQKHEGARRLA